MIEKLTAKEILIMMQTDVTAILVAMSLFIIVNLAIFVYLILKVNRTSHSASVIARFLVKGNQVE